MSVPLLLTVRQGLCASIQLRALVFSVSALLDLQEMEDTLVMVVMASNNIKYYSCTGNSSWRRKVTVENPFND